MTSTTQTNEVFKQDVRGRVRVPKERREALLREFATSGLSAAEFARLAGIKYPTFANWRQQQGRRRAVGGEVAEQAAAESEGPQSRFRLATGVRLLEAVVEDGSRPRVQPGDAGGLVIELPGGSRLTVVSPSQLPMAADLLALLAQRSRPC